MPFETTWERHGAYKKFHGHVPAEELVRSVTDIHGDARFDDLRYVINDFLDVASFTVTEDTVRYIAAIDSAAARSNPNIQVALVASDVQMQALADHYIVSPWTVFHTQLFGSVEEARAWVRESAGH